jgi:hypothetical protein
MKVAFAYRNVLLLSFAWLLLVVPVSADEETSIRAFLARVGEKWAIVLGGGGAMEAGELAHSGVPSEDWARLLDRPLDADERRKEDFLVPTSRG